ncbi:putative Histone acetyltransferases subunit 3 protein [Trachipleistophora hominis]|uniref:Putative Histone acetyltransferases subunit 3 protein n=1 Tax=Trachipleistophora hominis TaxID=72359 RepID=L7JX46_TRAHO|nr:putative Histone acetyltransferases subunit 3 protein [Trachipleistophora hominis]
MIPPYWRPMEFIGDDNEQQNVVKIGHKEQSSKTTVQDSLNGKIQNINTPNPNANKPSQSEVSYDDFNSFLQDFFSDITKDAFEEIVSFPVINVEDINVNLYKSKCIYLSQNEVNIDDLLVSALMSENNEESFVTKNRYEDDILFKPIKESETVVSEFFEKCKNFCEKIDLRNINIQEEDKIMGVLKKQIGINNGRRKNLSDILEKKLEVLSILKFLREIDKKIEKIAFKRIKNKRKKKSEDNIQQLLELIMERNQFYDAFKNEIETSLDVLSISHSIFNDENIDITSFGFAPKNFFPDP